ncbi:MAG TPA: glutamine synthetase family protein [Actinomycetota bacterium]
MARSNPEIESVGKIGFIKEYGLHTDDQQEAAKDLPARMEADGIKIVRFLWADQHGIARGKFITVHDAVATLRNGMDFQGATLVMDTGNHVFTPLFVEGGGFGVPEFTGFPDVVLVPDPTTYRKIPWSPDTAWIVSDMYFSNGKPVPFSSRQIMRRQVEAAAELGYEYAAGLEVEFYITRRANTNIGVNETGWPPAPPEVSVVAQGYQYLSEGRLAEIDPILQLLRENLEGIGLPLRSMEDEWGPGQTEFTFDPLTGVEAADAMLLFRTAAKQVCYHNGYHASFMCRPAFPNFFSSGWHLHESLVNAKDGTNAFTDPSQALSEPGRQFVAGILEHALPMTVFTTPTITGYKRFKPYSFAPDRVNWAVENRGAMVRVQGAPGDKSAHIENRMGEPAANPYLYMAANIAAGLDGIRNATTPPAIIEENPYESESPMLPTSLWEAVEHLEKDSFFRTEFGDPFIDFILMVKKSEIGRFLSEVTDWEMREYFEFY